MTEKILKAKHWQLFILAFGIPMIFQFFMKGTMFSIFDSEVDRYLNLMFSYMKFFHIMTIILLGVFFVWSWFVALGLQSKVPEGVKMKVKKFKIFVFILMVYVLFIHLFMVILMNGWVWNLENLMTSSGLGANLRSEMISLHSNGSLIPRFIAINVPLLLFSMFCIFYSLYFVAKTFKTVELQREVKFSDFTGEFFMIWFYPIGIWIVQPKINKMIKE